MTEIKSIILQSEKDRETRRLWEQLLEHRALMQRLEKSEDSDIFIKATVKVIRDKIEVIIKKLQVKYG